MDSGVDMRKGVVLRILPKDLQVGNCGFRSFPSSNGVAPLELVGFVFLFFYKYIAPTELGFVYLSSNPVYPTNLINHGSEVSCEK